MGGIGGAWKVAYADFALSSIKPPDVIYRPPFWRQTSSAGQEKSPRPCTRLDFEQPRWNRAPAPRPIS
jgi:hypothetical protein